MAFDAAQPEKPDVTLLSGDGNNGFSVRMNSDAGRAFKADGVARARAENAARMAKQARRDALPSLMQQAAALALVLGARR